MQGNQAQVMQLLACGSCYGSCTRLNKSSLIEVIFSAGRYLTTVPWPLLWQFEKKLKEVCNPLQNSLLGIFFKEVVPMAPWCGWWDNAVASGTKCLHTVQWARLPPAPTPPTLHHPWHRARTIGETLMLGDKRGLSPCAKMEWDLVKWFSSSHWWFSELK